MVGVRQRHELIDALQRHRCKAGPNSGRRRRTDGHGVQRQRDRLRRDSEREERRGPVPVRDGGRHDSRLVPHRQRDDRNSRRRSLVAESRLQRPRDPERPPVRDRLPQQPSRRLRRSVQAGDACGPLPGCEAAEGICAVWHPGVERQHLRHLREAGRRQKGRRPRRRPRLRRRVHPGREALGTRRIGGKEERTSERSLGAGARPLELRAVFRRRADRKLRQRSDQCLRGPRRR